MSEYDALKLDNQLCFPLYAAARKITGRYTPYLKPLDMTYTQYIVFMVLWEKDGVPVSEICDRLYLDSGTITPLLKKMEARGWVKRTRSEKDERVVIVTLTEEGWAMRDKCKDIPAFIGGCVKLDKGESAALYKLLYKLIGEL
jgi:DNA-binding MarR family transcriptional regulator